MSSGYGAGFLQARTYPVAAGVVAGERLLSSVGPENRTAAREMPFS